jgi:hypothetical protein
VVHVYIILNLPLESGRNAFFFYQIFIASRGKTRIQYTHLGKNTNARFIKEINSYSKTQRFEHFIFISNMQMDFCSIKYIVEQL